MGLFDFIGPASGLLFTLENIIWINLGVFIGCVFAAIPGLSVILCIILFLPVTYTMRAIPGMMFLLGIYCAGGYGGSVSAILINTPGTPHAAATMLDGHPLSKMRRFRAAHLGQRITVQHGSCRVGRARRVDKDSRHRAAVSTRTVDAQKEHHAGDRPSPTP